MRSFYHIIGGEGVRTSAVDSRGTRNRLYNTPAPVWWRTDAGPSVRPLQAKLHRYQRLFFAAPLCQLLLRRGRFDEGNGKLDESSYPAVKCVRI